MLENKKPSTKDKAAKAARSKTPADTAEPRPGDEEAFLALKPHLDQVGLPEKNAVKASSPDLARALEKIFTRELTITDALKEEWLARRVDDPEYPRNKAPLWVRLYRLGASGEFDNQVLVRLPLAAAAERYVSRRYQWFLNIEGRTQVPTDLKKKADDLEELMDSVLQYNVGRQEAARKALEYIRQGRKYENLAARLLGYRDLYIKYRAELVIDQRYYSPEHEDFALEYANAIQQSLAGEAGPETMAWANYGRKLSKLMLDDYRVLQLGAHLVLRDENGYGRFQSLLSLSRGPRARDPKVVVAPQPLPVVAKVPVAPAPAPQPEAPAKEDHGTPANGNLVMPFAVTPPKNGVETPS